VRAVARAAVVLAAAVLAGLPAAAASAQPAIAVTLAAQQVSVGVGDRVTVQARISFGGTDPSDRLIAHLSIVTLDPAVYVDLEDWTTSPTRQLGALPPGGSTSATWDIQAVNAGRFDVYVVVLPALHGPADQGQTVSEPELVEVAGRRTLNVGGVLPVTVAVPVLLALAALAARVRRRRAG
jgi:hypothetical protein